MSRVAAALMVWGLGICVLTAVACPAAATPDATLPPSLTIDEDGNDRASAADSKRKATPAMVKPINEPARQVPAELFEEEAGERPETTVPDQAERARNEATQQEPKEQSDETADDRAKVPDRTGKPDQASKGPAEDIKPAAIVETAGPDLPLRKPRKPVVRKPRDRKEEEQRPSVSRSKRDKKLCKALQACRNGFIECKGKITDPDQSEAWSIAKEECGAAYKACVEKEFQPGEWLFTRWFYFQELDCG